MEAADFFLNPSGSSGSFSCLLQGVWFICPFPKSRIFGQYHLGYLDEHATHEVDVLAGAFMLLRKEALVKTGLLDETFYVRRRY